MDLPETLSHSFVIRIWLEEINKDGHGVWRGHITHVLSGQRSYLDNLDRIAAFIELYLHTGDAEENTY